MRKDKTRKKNKTTVNIKFRLCCGDAENVVSGVGISQAKSGSLSFFFFFLIQPVS